MRLWKSKQIINWKLSRRHRLLFSHLDYLYHAATFRRRYLWSAKMDIKSDMMRMLQFEILKPYKSTEVVSDTLVQAAPTKVENLWLSVTNIKWRPANNEILSVLNLPMDAFILRISGHSLQYTTILLPYFSRTVTMGYAMGCKLLLHFFDGSLTCQHRCMVSNFIAVRILELFESQASSSDFQFVLEQLLHY